MRNPNLERLEAQVCLPDTENVDLYAPNLSSSPLDEYKNIRLLIRLKIS